MGDFKQSQEVWICCEAQPGAFPDERLVTVDTIAGPISGFVKTADLERPDASETRVRGRIIAIDDHAIKVRIAGSFFTTATGIASVSRGLLAA